MKSNGRNEWYVIVWRLLWLPVVFVARGLFCLSVLIMRGPAFAADMWEATK